MNTDGLGGVGPFLSSLALTSPELEIEPQNTGIFGIVLLGSMLICRYSESLALPICSL